MREGQKRDGGWQGDGRFPPKGGRELGWMNRVGYATDDYLGIKNISDLFISNLNYKASKY